MRGNVKNYKQNNGLSVLMDLIPDPVIAINNEGKIVFANKIIGKFTGYTGEQIIGRNFSELSFISKEYRLLIAKNEKKISRLQAHDGAIISETTKDKETTFTVTLQIEPTIDVGGEKTWIKIPEFS